MFPHSFKHALESTVFAEKAQKTVKIVKKIENNFISHSVVDRLQRTDFICTSFYLQVPNLRISMFFILFLLLDKKFEIIK